MKNKKITIHALVAFASLSPSSGHAFDTKSSDSVNEISNLENVKVQNLGFDPRNAINTLESLDAVGVTEISAHGEFDLPVNQLNFIRTQAFLEQLDILVVNVSPKTSTLQLKLKQQHLNDPILNYSQIERLKKISNTLKLMCDADHPTGGG
jgi:hypothetical protein